MRPGSNIPLWIEAPFLRLLPPWTAGILLQENLQLTLPHILTACCCFAFAYLLFRRLPLSWQFQWQPLQGLLLMLLLAATAMLVTRQQDPRQQTHWYGHQHQPGEWLQVALSEPPERKPHTLKAVVRVLNRVRNQQLLPCSGKLLLYLSLNDSTAASLRFGHTLLIRAQLQPIRNSGNPGAFNYAAYAARRGLFHQAFLRPGQWTLTPEQQAHPFWQGLYQVRDAVLRQLRTYVKGSEEAGIAEALLIGYTQDLDKDLVQAYSNTGVVHIIAISGMHLGLIYGLLLGIFTRLPLVKRSGKLQAVLILTALWLFALLAGASASVIRSAVMFSFLTTGRFFFKRSSTFNALAGSALLMLAWNPGYLWDLGFQLSFSAITGIIWLQRPLYHLLFIPWKLPDLLWQAVSITLAAQVLTFPLCLYHFHQFPLSFLVSNLVAVPLSTLVLYACIALLALCGLTPVAQLTGTLISWLLQWLNGFIRMINNWPLAVWDQIPANGISTLLLYGAVMAGAAWLLYRSTPLLVSALSCMAAFLACHAWADWRAMNQQRIIIYHIPKQQAIDFAAGKQYHFVGDSIRLPHFHLRPARTALRLSQPAERLPSLQQHGNAYQLGNRRLVLIEQKPAGPAPATPVYTDYLVLSHNPDATIEELLPYYRFRWLIIDASNPLWKIEAWKQACERLHLQCHPVTEQGAFLSD